jgi:hypothetical protein
MLLGQIGRGHMTPTINLRFDPMLGWWNKWQYRTRLAEVDATVLIARYGVRASHIANCRIDTMRNGSAFDANRPPCHWKRVRSITRQLLPYDGDDGTMIS